jgi:glycosyltransferase involved in cell wall biosynthesis
VTTLSVIVPMQNVAPYLADLLCSLTRNARADFEFIFVDDGSSDSSAEVLEGHRAKLPGFTLIRHPQARGASVARNAGLAAASGRYITYVDGDDWLAPGYLQKAVEAIDGLGCDFIRIDHIQTCGRTREIHRAPHGVRGKVLDARDGFSPVHDVAMVDYPYAWAGVYRRTLAEDGLLTFDEELLTAEDRLWIWQLHQHAASYAVVSLFGVYYRRGVTTSLTQVGDERQLHFFDAFDKILAALRPDPDWDRVKYKFVRAYCALIATHEEKRERLSPSLQERQRLRAGVTLRGLPQDVLAAVLPGMRPKRADLLRELMATGGTR